MENIRNSSGFTLIEVMVALAVLAVVTAIAVPSYTTFLESNRRAASTTAFTSSMNYARTEALRRNAIVTINSTNGTADFKGGWTVDTGGVTLATYLALSPGFTFAAATVPGGTPVTTFSFSGRGYLNTPTANVSLQLCHGTGSKGSQYTIQRNGLTDVQPLTCP